MKILRRTPDLTGLVFGRLTVVGIRERSKTGKSLWLCRCECGGEVLVRLSNLCGGTTQSCGCIAKERLSRLRKMDLVGKVFGRLTVIREYPERDNGRVRWWCSCSCGMGVLVVGVHLTNGLTRSCGCLRNELARKRKLGRTKFGSIEEKLRATRAAYKKISEAPLKSKSSLLSRILPCDNPLVKNGFITVTCKTCGKRFAPSKRSVTKRIASTEGRGPGQNNFYCSQACKIACPSFNAKPNQQDPRLRSSISQRQKTRSCQTRSLKKLQCDKVGYTYCERCGDLMPELHHTITVGKDPVGAINPAGHILLCVRCHLEVHRSCK